MSKGRPTKFTEAKEKKAIELAEKGFTDKMISDVLGIDEKTLNNWKNKYEDFFLSLKEAKYIHDLEVQESLLKNAKGYTKKVEKVVASQHGAEVVKYDKFFPGNTAAQIIWLKNRMPEQWRDKQENTVSDITINFAYENDETKKAS